MRLTIAELRHVSLVDVIESLAFVLWLPYCNLRCPWCFAAPIVRGEKVRSVSMEDLRREIELVLGFVEFIHVTGGEPTLHAQSLTALLKLAHDLSLKGSIATNATNPHVVKSLVDSELLDHIAIDYKAPLGKPEKYAELTGRQIPGGELVQRVGSTLRIAVEGVPLCEIRTTLAPGLEREDVMMIAEEVARLSDRACGRVVFVLQAFVPAETLLSDDYKRYEPTRSEEILSLAKRIAEEFSLEVYARTLERGIVRVRDADSG